MQLNKVEIVSLLTTGALLLLRWFCRYVLLPAAQHLVGVWLWKRTVKTEREALEWMHHKYRVMRSGHQHSDVKACSDGQCAKVN